jgi:hypothetical protein
MVTLSTPTMFDNRTMGAPTDSHNEAEPRPNADVAAAVFEAPAGTHVGIVTDGIERSMGLDDAQARRSKCAGPGRNGSFDSTSASSAGSDDQPPTSTDDTQPGDPSTVPGEGSTPDNGSVPGSGQGQGEGQGESQGRNQGQGQGQGRGQGDEQSAPGLFDHLSPGVLLALAQLAAAALWFLVRKARRDAVVAEENLPVSVGSSRVVEASAALRRRAGDATRSGEDLRRRTREQLNIELGLARSGTAPELARTIAQRTGRDAAATLAVIDGAPVESDDDLLSLGRALDDLRASVTTR